MTLQKLSPCKVNLILNILGKRADGFHELETIMQPVAIHDELEFAPGGNGIELTCSDPTLPTDRGNLVYRAAAAFLEQAAIRGGVRIHLEKKLPLAAGLGGGSANAAVTLLGLNELFGGALTFQQLTTIAASLGSDVPFFLQRNPALATGRGEQVKPLDPFPALKGTAILLVHPGFGISTAWSYNSLAKYPSALNGTRGRAEGLISQLQTARPEGSVDLYNSLEAPALEKYPLLVLFQEFFREQGVLGTLMSGSGSTTFAICADLRAGETLREKFKERFGSTHWMGLVSL
jgi:4-diphosphocytidyl-2-C-methyl-D-erythritol kinase